VLIVVFDKFADLAFEIWDGLERAATDGPLSDQPEQKLLMTMARFALGKDLAVGDIQSGKERRGPMAKVIVRDPLDVSESHRKDRLRTFEGLHLTLLVYAQNQGVSGGLR
jgi:hypothetical protein